MYVHDLVHPGIPSAYLTRACQGSPRFIHSTMQLYRSVGAWEALPRIKQIPGRRNDMYEYAPPRWRVPGCHQVAKETWVPMG